MVLQGCHQSIDGLIPKSTPSFFNQLVSFVDEQNTIYGILDNFLGFSGCTTDMVCQQIACLDFNGVTSTEKTNFMQHLTKQPGYSGLTSTGITGKYHMHHRQVDLFDPGACMESGNISST